MKKEEFLKVYNEYKPDFIVKKFYEYFSATSKSNFKDIFVGILLVLFIVGMVLTGANIEPFGKIIGLIFCSLIGIFGIIGLYVIISNRIRIFKITRKLKISNTEYNNYVMVYGSEKD